MHKNSIKKKKDHWQQLNKKNELWQQQARSMEVELKDIFIDTRLKEGFCVV